MFTTSYRSDRRKHPKQANYRLLTNEECRNLSGHAHLLDMVGKITEVKITSVKTWKRQPDKIEIHCKWGLYDYFTVSLNEFIQNETFVKILDEG